MVVFHYKNDLLALQAIFHSVISSFFIQNKAGVGGTVQVAFNPGFALFCFWASWPWVLTGEGGGREVG